MRLTLGERSKPSAKIAAELISDLGELVVIDKLDEAISVPFGQYRVSSLKLEVPDAGGQTWTYNFYYEKTRNYTVPTNQETTVALLGQLDMRVTLHAITKRKHSRPGKPYPFSRSLSPTTPYTWFHARWARTASPARPKRARKSSCFRRTAKRSTAA